MELLSQRAAAGLRLGARAEPDRAALHEHDRVMPVLASDGDGDARGACAVGHGPALAAVAGRVHRRRSGSGGCRAHDEQIPRASRSSARWRARRYSALRASGSLTRSMPASRRRAARRRSAARRLPAQAWQTVRPAPGLLLPHRGHRPLGIRRTLRRRARSRSRCFRTSGSRQGTGVSFRGWGDRDRATDRCFVEGRRRRSAQRGATNDEPAGAVAVVVDPG